MEEALRCAQRALEAGEVPVGAVVVCDGRIVGRGWNQNITGFDPTAHAEIMALREAGATMGNHRLGDCELFATIEPCAMCAFAVRETRISRVAFCIRSPMMGGLSKWDVLRDPELSHAMPEVFGPVPEVIAGLLRSEAENVWRRWNPLFWAIIQQRGYLGGGGPSEYLPAIPGRRNLLRRLFTLHKNR